MGVLAPSPHPRPQFPWVLLVVTNQFEWLLLRGIISVQRSPTIHQALPGWWMLGGGRMVVWDGGGEGGVASVCLDGLWLYSVIPSLLPPIPTADYSVCQSLQPPWHHLDTDTFLILFLRCLPSNCFDYVGASLEHCLVRLQCINHPLITCAGFVSRNAWLLTHLHE